MIVPCMERPASPYLKGLPTEYQLGLERRCLSMTGPYWQLEPSRFTTIAGAALHLLCRCQEDRTQRRVVILDAPGLHTWEPMPDSVIQEHGSRLLG